MKKNRMIFEIPYKICLLLIFLVRKTSHWIDKFWRSFEIKNDFRNENLLSHILKWTPLRNLVSCPVHIREFCEDYQKSHRVWLHCRHPVWLLPYREIRLSAQPSVLNTATRKDEYTVRYIFITKTRALTSLLTKFQYT